jgi:predicted DNA-binding transcriptional regulator YafY
MTDGSSNLIAVEFTPDEARLIVAALRQFEPFWPSDMDDMGRAELLTGIRQGIEHVVAALDAPRTSAS